MSPFLSLAAFAALSSICQAATLVPLSYSDLGIQRRSAPSVTLQPKTSLYFGTGSNESSVLVNVTLETGDEELIVSTDHFVTEIKSLSCAPELSLTFTSNDVYQDAINDWDWVNFNENRTFIMLVDGCPQGDINPWIVSNATYDLPNLAVHFDAVQTTFNNLTTMYTLEWGTFEAPTPEPALESRWSISSLDPAISADKSFSVNVAYAFPETLYSEQTKNGLGFSIDCDNCGTQGSFTVSGHAKGTVIPLEMEEFWFSVQPVGFEVDLGLALNVEGTLGQDWTELFNIATLTIPEFDFLGEVSFGPSVVIDAGFTLSAVHGSATISSGVKATLSNSAIATVALEGGTTAESGWEPTVVLEPLEITAEIDGKLELYLQIGLDLQIKVFGDAWGAGVQAKIPDVTFTAEASYDSAGTCGTTKPFGISATGQVGVDIPLQVYTGSISSPDIIYSNDLYSNADLDQFLNVCYAFGTAPVLPWSMTTILAPPTATPTTTVISQPVKASSSVPAAAAKTSTKEGSAPTTSVVLPIKSVSTPAAAVTSTTEGPITLSTLSSAHPNSATSSTKLSSVIVISDSSPAAGAATSSTQKPVAPSTLVSVSTSTKETSASNIGYTGYTGSSSSSVASISSSASLTGYLGPGPSVSSISSAVSSASVSGYLGTSRSSSVSSASFVSPSASISGYLSSSGSSVSESPSTPVLTTYPVSTTSTAPAQTPASSTVVSTASKSTLVILVSTSIGGKSTSTSLVATSLISTTAAGGLPTTLSTSLATTSFTESVSSVTVTHSSVVATSTAADGTEIELLTLIEEIIQLETLLIEDEEKNLEARRAPIGRYKRF